MKFQRIFATALVTGVIVGGLAGVAQAGIQTRSYDGCTATTYNSAGFGGYPIAYTSRQSGTCNLGARLWYHIFSGNYMGPTNWHYSYAESLAPVVSTLHYSEHWLDN